LRKQKNPPTCADGVHGEPGLFDPGLLVLLILLILAIANGAAQHGTRQGTETGALGGFAVFIVADDAADEPAQQGALGGAPLGLVHGTGTADQAHGECPDQSQSEEFVFHDVFPVFI